MMKKNYLNRGIVCVFAGICFLLAAILTETVFDGLLWGLAGGALGPGVGLIIKYFYWTSPQNADRYQELLEQEDINLHDELNEKLRDKSGRIAYLIGLLVLCVSEVIFAFLGKMGMITDHKIIVLYLFGLFLLQVIIGNTAYYYLRKKY